MTIPFWVEKGIQPPNSDAGDPVPDRIFLAVGNVTHAWEVLETTINATFQIASQSPHGGALAGFSSITSTHARIKALDSCIRWFSASTGRIEIYNEFKKIQGRIRHLDGIRNFCAHGVVAHREGNFFQFKMKPIPQGNFFLIKPLSDTTSSHTLMIKRWYASDILTQAVEVICDTASKLEDLTYRKMTGNQNFRGPTTGKVRGLP